MKLIQFSCILMLKVLLFSAFFAYTVVALPIRESVESIADRLVSDQAQGSINPGIWPEEGGFTGSIVAGMVDAYELTCNEAYKESAKQGGYYILWSSFGKFFYGDEAYGLSRLSEISDNPNDNPWRDALNDFYWFVKTDPGGTPEYIDRFIASEPSTTVFYLANHVVAAYYVNADDKEIWRQGLIDWLSLVDDDSSLYPVMALGVATWALAETSPLNETMIDPNDPNGPSILFWNTLIDPNEDGAIYWNKRTLSDLPNLLLTHQVPDERPYAGSFYWQFAYDVNDPNSYIYDVNYPINYINDGTNSYIYTHDINDPNAYTEDTIFPTNGLVAINNAVKTYLSLFNTNIYDPNICDPNICDPNVCDPNFYIPSFNELNIFEPNKFDPNILESAILKAREVLINSISPKGKVFETLFQEGELLYVYAGEMLQALNALHIPGDINMDGQVNCFDLEILLNKWQVSDCDLSCWCNGADINHDGNVDENDLMILIDYWLKGKT